MDLSSPLKPETLRPFVTVVVPGLVAISPYVLLLGFYVPPVQQFWTSHTSAFAVFLAAAVLAAGFIVSDFGELLEVHCWDKKLSEANPSHDEEWSAYLRLQLDDQIIAQRFLRTKLTQFKFELAMVPSLVLFWIGLSWYQAVHGVWSFMGYILFSFAVMCGSAFLAWESFQTAQSLATARQRILEAIHEGPKGVAKSAV